jgi:hypothetical protein
MGPNKTLASISKVCKASTGYPSEISTTYNSTKDEKDMIADFESIFEMISLPRMREKIRLIQGGWGGRYHL